MVFCLMVWGTMYRSGVYMNNMVTGFPMTLSMWVRADDTLDDGVISILRIKAEW